MAEWSKAPDLGSGLVEAWVQTPPPSSFFEGFSKDFLFAALETKKTKRQKDKTKRQKVRRSGLEPETFAVLKRRHNHLDHQRLSTDQALLVIQVYKSKTFYVIQPSVAQLVEHAAVELAVTAGSLVRFRPEG